MKHLYINKDRKWQTVKFFIILRSDLPLTLHGPPKVSQAQFSWFSEILAAALQRQELSPSQVTRVFCSLLDGHLGEAEIAGFLVAMRAKGETAGELAAAAQVLRQRMQRFDAGRDD